MPKFRVGVKEVWEQMYEVEADTKEDAIMKLDNTISFGDVDEAEDVLIMENEFEVDCVLDKEDWVVYD